MTRSMKCQSCSIEVCSRPGSPQRLGQPCQPKSGPCVTYTATGQESPVRSAWTKGPRRIHPRVLGTANKTPKKKKNVNFTLSSLPIQAYHHRWQCKPLRENVSKTHHHPCKSKASSQPGPKLGCGAFLPAPFVRPPGTVCTVHHSAHSGFLMDPCQMRSTSCPLLYRTR